LNGWFTIDSTVTENTVKYMAIVMTRVNIVTKMGENILSFFSYPQSVSCRISNVGTLHLLQSEVV
jgi:hypothetical protein